MTGFGLSDGIGLGIGNVEGGGGELVATSTFTMSQIASIDTKRVYQRSTTTGGGEGKGQGTVPITISGALAGTVVARCRSSDGSTILQDPWEAATIAESATSVDITGVDARLGWFYLDLKDVTGSWKNGTVLIGMGRVVGFAGQSLTARMFGRQDSQTATYSSLGLSVDANCMVLGSYNETNAYQPTIATQAWSAPGDVGDGNGFNAVGIGEFLRLQIDLFGVNCGAVAHSQGGARLGSFILGQANWTRLSSYFDRVDNKFEAFIWGQGHTDASYGMPPLGYATGLDLIHDQLDAANDINFAMYVWTIPNINNSSWGTPYERNRLRNGAIDWCTANSATYVHMYDIPQVDNVHPTQAGSVDMAYHMHRATRAEAGATSGIGPVVTSASRSGTTITATLSDVGQTDLVLAGSPEERVFVFSADRVNRHASQSDNRFPVSTVTVIDKTTLEFELANDPGDAHVLDLYLYWPSDGAGTPESNTIKDDRTDGDGISGGRLVQANANPVVIAAPNAGGSTNAPPGGYVAATSPFNVVGTSTVFAASGTSGFGNEMTGGTGLAVGNACPIFSPITAEGWITCPTIPGSVQVFFGGLSSGFIGINTSGKVYASVNGKTVIGATTMVAGKRYHIALQSGPTGTALYLTNVTDAGSGTRDAFDATAIYAPPGGARYALRNHSGSFALSGGAIDEWAVFQEERYSGASYTAPTAPFDGSEDNIVALYHCDETTGATTLVESIAA